METTTATDSALGAAALGTARDGTAAPGAPKGGAAGLGTAPAVLVGQQLDAFEELAEHLVAAGPVSGPAVGESGGEGPLGVSFDLFSDASLVDWAQKLERVARLLGAFQVQAAGALAQRVRAARFTEIGISKPAALLMTSLQLSSGEAGRRLNLAEHFLADVDSLTGQLSPAPHPFLGAAFFAGQLSMEQASVAAKFAQEATHLSDAGRIPEELARQVEQTMTHHALQECPDFLRRIGLRTVSLLDPDGQCPTEGELTSKQGIVFRQPRRGIIHFEGGMTVLQYDTLLSAVGWATNPNGHKNLGEHSASEPQSSAVPGDWPHVVDGIRVPGPTSMEHLDGLNQMDPDSVDPAVRDRRTHAQKLLDGIIDCVKLAARSGKLSLNGGLKTQLIVTTTRKGLQSQTPQGRQGGMVQLPFAGPQAGINVAEAYCDAEVTTVLLGDGQEVLGVGRTKRLFTPAQRKILLARDQGCAFPDCMAPAHWCEAHHIKPWQHGGLTDINNAALLCSHHHTLMHNSQWSLELVHGTPTFTPPYRLDPQQVPRQNNFHHAKIQI